MADSPLVKTAIAGADPNWGRIVSAAGYAGVPFDPAGVDLRVNGFLLYERAHRSRSTPPRSRPRFAKSRHARRAEVWRRRRRIRFWTTDLTAEYVRLNADYHT